MSPVDSIPKALNRAVAEGVFPGAVLLVRVRGERRVPRGGRPSGPLIIRQARSRRHHL